MPGSDIPIRTKSSSRTAALKEAIIASFALDSDPAHLAGFGESDWLSILWWLDINGMAIHFYNRACQIDLDPLLPREVRAGLMQRISKNRVRAKVLLDEVGVLTTWFQTGNIPYSLLRGVALTPQPLQESGLHTETDLDFLIAHRSLDLAIHYVHRLGYRLHAQNSNALEFRARPTTVPILASNYLVNKQRALVLRLAKDGTGECQLLSRRVMYKAGRLQFYALSPADILVEQARHLLRHLCGEYMRLSWVFEFWRYLGSLRGDTDFWHRAESCAAELTHGDVAMGMAFWLTVDLFGHTPGPIPAKWCAEALPNRARLWLERYARSLLLSDTIGSRLDALLRKELLGVAQYPLTTCPILLPPLSPATIRNAQPNESRSQRSARYYIATGFDLRRLWFHLREGVRFAVEASRWNRAVARIGR